MPRKPTPPAILQARGSNYNPPTSGTTPAEMPPRPATLDADELAIWDTIANWLFERGTIHGLDTHALERYCRDFIRWRAAAAIVASLGATYESTATNGATKFVERPESRLMARLSNELLKMERQFGMTPASRIPATKPETIRTTKSRFFNPTAGA